MTPADHYDNQIPDYYTMMYKDGYTPEQIAYALHRKMIEDYEDRQMVNAFKIISEVKLK